MQRGDDLPVRLGFTVTKKVGNAVDTQTARGEGCGKRRGCCWPRLRRPAPDLVLVGRDTTRTRPFTLLIDDLRRCLAKLGVASETRP